MPATADKRAKPVRRRQGAARIKEVARLASVSTATVSRALASPGLVSPETRSRVMEAVAKVGYVPNPAARTLRSRKTHMVLVVLPDLSNIFFSQVLRGIEEALFAAGYGMIIGDLNGAAEKERRFADFAAAGQVDGVMLLNGHLFGEAELGVPVVALCEAIEGADIPQIEVENRKGARAMTEHLARLGHRAIGYVTGPTDNVLERERFAGYREGLERAGLAFDPGLVWEGDWKLETGAEIGRRILSEDKRQSAVFCSNDEMAIGLLRAFASAGVRVPEDISVAGFDDIEYAAMTSPALTTIRQPRRDIGREGASALLELLGGRKPAPRIRLQTELVERASAAAPKHG
jgi:LacI family repressor for deo operon, udp, cdd, tsx, nupC, and nupG